MHFNKCDLYLKIVSILFLKGHLPYENVLPVLLHNEVQIILQSDYRSFVLVTMKC